MSTKKVELSQPFYWGEIRVPFEGKQFTMPTQEKQHVIRKNKSPIGIRKFRVGVSYQDTAKFSHLSALLVDFTLYGRCHSIYTSPPVSESTYPINLGSSFF
ncbi:uncharacterized protein A4U43_C06F9270 [Asparagus officinalis]|uniref:Uncharacterized protein n=1 Tax=Asparagus officinalis TaxID=4686 RepID=A0A5P1EKP0_ASPOF|nr:uncharacterized protein A4U43_C06F9270 [Asparagus officinalis]